jgi:hypothetical protein
MNAEKKSTYKRLTIAVKTFSKQISKVRECLKNQAVAGLCRGGLFRRSNDFVWKSGGIRAILAFRETYCSFPVLPTGKNDWTLNRV